MAACAIQTLTRGFRLRGAERSRAGQLERRSMPRQRRERVVRRPFVVSRVERPDATTRPSRRLRPREASLREPQRSLPRRRAVCRTRARGAPMRRAESGRSRTRARCGPRLLPATASAVSAEPREGPTIRDAARGAAARPLSRTTTLRAAMRGSEAPRRTSPHEPKRRSLPVNSIRLARRDEPAAAPPPYEDVPLRGALQPRSRRASVASRRSYESSRRT